MASTVQHQTNATPALTNTEGKARIDGWLNYRLRITIADSRAFEGRFKCVDRDCNIVLAGTEEFKDSTPPVSFYPPPFMFWVGFRRVC
jgi:LSM domain